MANAEWELQKSVYSKLIADATLMALVVGVYDYVPSDTLLDYVTIGDDDVKVNDTKTNNGFLVAITINSWSENNGRSAVKKIMGEVYRVLHRTTLTIAGFSHIQTQFELSKTFRDEDEKTYHGVQTFEIYLE